MSVFACALRPAPDSAGTSLRKTGASGIDGGPRSTARAGRWLVLAVVIVLALLAGSADPPGADASYAYWSCIEDNNPARGACPASTAGLSGVNSVVVSPDGRSVYAASGGISGSSGDDDAVVRLDRDTSTGAVTAAGCIGPTLSGCGASIAGLDRPRALALSPDGQSLYVSASRAIFRFIRNPATGALAAAGCIAGENAPPALCSVKAPGLLDPEALAVSPDGRFVYATSQNLSARGAVATLARDPGSGALTPVGCVRDDGAFQASACATSAAGLAHANGIALSGDGRSLYVGSGFFAGAGGAVAHFSVVTATGALTPVSCIQDAGGAQGVAARPPVSLAPGVSPLAPTEPRSTRPARATARSSTSFAIRAPVNSRHGAASTT